MNNQQQQQSPMQNMSQQPNLPNYPQQNMLGQQQQPPQQHQMNIPQQQGIQHYPQHPGQDISNQYPPNAAPLQQAPIHNQANNPQPQSMLQGQLQARPNIGPNMQQNPNVNAQQQQQLQQQLAGQHPQHPQQHPQAGMHQSPTVICRYASDLIQDFLTRTTETFQVLRGCSPHMMTNKNAQEDRRNRLRELTKSLKVELNRIRSIYIKVKSIAVSEEELPNALESIIQFEIEKPLPWDSPSKFEEYNSIDKMNVHESRWFSMKPGPQISEEQRSDNPKMAALEQQYQDLLELNAIRNRQLKEVIHQMRQLIWSTNDMLAMRKP